MKQHWSAFASVLGSLLAVAATWLYARVPENDLLWIVLGSAGIAIVIGVSLLPRFASRSTFDKFATAVATLGLISAVAFYLVSDTYYCSRFADDILSCPLE